jgi:hypothetical protein
MPVNTAPVPAEPASQFARRVPPEHLPFLRALGKILASWALRDPRLRHLANGLERRSQVR